MLIAHIPYNGFAKYELRCALYLAAAMALLVAAVVVLDRIDKHASFTLAKHILTVITCSSILWCPLVYYYVVLVIA